METTVEVVEDTVEEASVEDMEANSVEEEEVVVVVVTVEELQEVEEATVEEEVEDIVVEEEVEEDTVEEEVEVLHKLTSS